MEHNSKGRRAFLLLGLHAFLAGCTRILTGQETPSVSAPPTAEEITEVAAPLENTPQPSPQPITVVETATPVPVALADGFAPIGYYLPLVTRHVTETTATFFFDLEVPATGVLLLEPSEGGPQQVIPLDAAQKRHVVPIEGLQPNTHYRASVGLGDGMYQAPALDGSDWGSVTFTTQGPNRPIRFAAFADSGFGDQRTIQLTQEIAALELDFFLHAGDCVYWAYQQETPRDAWKVKWYDALAPLHQSMPVYSVNGNHDYDGDATHSDGLPFYWQASPPLTDPNFEPSARAGLNQYYAVAYGDVQFVFLDSQVLFGQPGRQEQEEWLAQRLADDRWRSTIPIYHVAAYSSGDHGDSDSWVPRQTWGPLFNSNPRVHLTIAGHDHNYERLIVQDTTYIVCGGGSSTLYGKTVELPESQIYASMTSFALFELYDDRIEVSGVALGGDVLDQATVALV